MACQSRLARALPGEPLTALLQGADVAIHEAKACGRDRLDVAVASTGDTVVTTTSTCQAACGGDARIDARRG